MDSNYACSTQPLIPEWMDRMGEHTIGYRTSKFLLNYVVSPILVSALIITTGVSGCENKGKKVKEQNTAIPVPATRDVPVQLEGIVK